MKRYTALGAAAAAVLVGAGTLVFPAVANGSTTTHTLRFTAVQTAATSFSRTSFGEQDKDKRHGKVIGFDVVNGRLDTTTHTAHGWVSLSTRGGMLRGTLRFSNGPITRGRVTGGTGRFAGATGTIYAKALNSAGTRNAVVIHYQN
jgi:hypothetical protein